MDQIGEFLKQLLDKNEIALNNNYNSFFKSWDKIAGERLSDYTKVKDISNNQLIIEVSHPGWLQMFQFEEQKILKKIRKEYPELKIKTIKLILKERTEKNKSATEEPDNEPSVLPDPDNKMFNSVKNSELKLKLQKLYNTVLKKSRKNRKNKENKGE